MDRDDGQKRVKAGRNAFPPDHQSTVLLLKPGKGPLGLEPRDHFCDRSAAVFLGLPDALRELCPDTTALCTNRHTPTLASALPVPDAAATRCSVQRTLPEGLLHQSPPLLSEQIHDPYAKSSASTQNGTAASGTSRVLSEAILVVVATDTTWKWSRNVSPDVRDRMLDAACAA